MQPKPGSPESWLIYAKSDLALAKSEARPEILLETLCFHAQQAAEKALKAVLIYSHIPAPKTHSIERLVDLLPLSIDRVHLLIDAAQLTDYAVTFRYPGDELPISTEEYNEAIRFAEAVFMWAKRIVK